MLQKLAVEHVFDTPPFLFLVFLLRIVFKDSHLSGKKRQVFLKNFLTAIVFSLSVRQSNRV